MKCDSVREKLTAYLDGELEDERGSAVRGHLRSCDACRQVAADEAALRDGLRALPPLDPPASLWAGVQARLAAEEVKDAERPGWARALAWLKPRAPQLGLAGVALAAAIVLVAVRLSRDEAAPAKTPPPGPSEIAVKQTDPPTQTDPPPRPMGQCDLTAKDGDVTAALESEQASQTACLEQTARERLEVAMKARGTWPAERQRDFDIEIASLQKAITISTDHRPRRDAYRKMIRFLQRAENRDDVAIASLGGVQ